MSEKREGPSVTLDRSCNGCRWERSVGYRCQGDSGYDVYCDHPSRSGRHVGDTRWVTPDWCPVAPAHVLVPAARLAALEAIEEAARLITDPTGNLTDAWGAINDALAALDRLADEGVSRG